jgi:hypothetical protein
MQLTKEQIERAAAAKSSDELIELASANGIDLTPEEAEKYHQQLSSAELSAEDIEKVAGGCLANLCAGDACANLC